MKLATQTYVPSLKLGFEGGMKAIKDAGFDSVDLSLFRMDKDDNIFVSDKWKEEAHRERCILDSLALPCTQAHAPHIFDFSNEESMRSMIMPRITRSMEIARIFGAKCIVIHPLHHLDYITKEKEIRKRNLEYMRTLARKAEELDIIIGFENMWQRDTARGCIVPNTGGLAKDLVADIDSIGSKYVRACFDVGHSALVGEPPQNAIRTLGRERLVALHVHDNNLKEDLHTLPYLGKLEWDEIMIALKEIGYSGDFTYEADSFLMNMPAVAIPDALKLMSTIGRFLVSKTI